MRPGPLILAQVTSASAFFYEAPAAVTAVTPYYVSVFVPGVITAPRAEQGVGRTIESLNQNLPERGEAARGHAGTVTRGHGA